MKHYLQNFLLMLAGATDKELAKQVQYLKEENRILRDRLPKRIQVTPQERSRLLKFGREVGTAIKSLITIVTPRTFLRWLNQDNEKSSRSTPRKVGRRRTPEEIRELVVRLATENSWGYTRILGELRKLGINKICRSTVVNILKEEGLDPGPKRGSGSWAEFVKRHAQTLWACDFFSKKVFTGYGFVDVFVLFFINVGTRRVHVVGMTPHPDARWMAQQARNVAMFFDEQPEKPRMLIRDLDTKFTKQFDAILEDEDIEIKPVGPRAPNMNPFSERWLQALKHECLDHFIVCGEAHLRYLIAEYLDYFHNQRPHQSLENRPPSSDGDDAPPAEGEVVREERLGGLLKHYYRRAA